ncbi:MULTISPECIES: TatD family hydrolase [unclassified Corynebacterium]|uniref:TatD family hydrolase n=1 Tax=unclassified Corynebacterium TaxID=2624378 RepID=UPI002169F233|nr:MULTISPECIES: TatD family hydrolase [unclassified Corynebacterium]MCS4489998.1 TatD family hydrolase [Corynebacterium sp. ES2775-CONJ]MCS4491639.1 TatD family hydrolase [Corynebacterium sp. ES2715-CONJ3]MCS4531744.1 TatD family hydrolase [Corynebacterium sp. ES2730-CONJ]
MGKKKPRPLAQPYPRIPLLVDAHTHLASCGARNTSEIKALVDRALASGVEKLCTVGDGLDEAVLALTAAQVNPRIFAAVAIHPTRAGELDEVARDQLTRMAGDERCVAVGETGLDTYWITHAPESTASLDIQEEAFRWHIDLAVKTNKALMIHNREADADLLRILADAPRPREVILHCFSSPVEVALEAIDRGYILSFAGNLTFKRNDHLRQAAALAPMDQILVETDAPYMTPEPYRGVKNEPALIGHTAAVIAHSRGMELEECAYQIYRNFHRAYGLDETLGTI